MWDLHDEQGELSRWEVDKKARLASDRLCEECFDEIIPKYRKGDIQAIKDKIIEENQGDTEKYLSTGKLPNDNIGCRWVRSTEWYD